MKTKRLNVVAPVAPVTPPTPEMAATKVLEYAVRSVTNDLNMANASLADWVARFANDAADAFSWSHNAFETAACAKVAEEFLEHVKCLKEERDEYTVPSDAHVMKMVCARLNEMVMRAARYPERSTSTQSNDMSLQMMARRADLLEKLARLIENSKEF